MTDATNSPFFGRKRITAYAGRGQTYNWLRAYHDEVAAKLAAEEITWPALAADMARQGVLGRWGKPPTANAALRVWRRVCDDVREKRAAAEAAASRSGGTYPSRIPKTWRPEVVPPQANPAAGPAGTAEPYDPMEQLAHLRRTVAERSGRKQ